MHPDHDLEQFYTHSHLPGVPSPFHQLPPEERIDWGKRMEKAQFEAWAKLHHYDLVRCSHEPYAAYRSDLTNAALAGWRGANRGVEQGLYPRVDAAQAPLTDDQILRLADACGLYGVRRGALAFAREVLKDAYSASHDTGVPDCNGSHDYVAIAAGEQECTACCPDEAQPEDRVSRIAIVVTDVIETFLLWNGQASAGLDVNGLAGLRDELVALAAEGVANA